MAKTENTLEPEALLVYRSDSATAIQLSIAISLKRVADALEKAFIPPTEGSAQLHDIFWTGASALQELLQRR